MKTNKLRELLHYHKHYQLSVKCPVLCMAVAFRLFRSIGGPRHGGSFFRCSVFHRVQCSILPFSVKPVQCVMLTVVTRLTAFPFTHRRRLHRRSNRELCPGTHRYTSRNQSKHHVILWYLSGAYFEFWSESPIIALIAFTKCSPFSRINWLIPIVSHF